jgi:hypothetical protein
MVLLPPPPNDVCIIVAETLISFGQNGIRECSDNLNIVDQLTFGKFQSFQQLPYNRRLVDTTRSGSSVIYFI